MAAPHGCRFARLSRYIGVFPRTAVCENPGTVRTQCRTAVSTSSGAILPKPKKISKNFAALLEEHDIFVPEDDDDDD
ncbi:essential MCU regulator, mitochondrial [Silurus meridionalis]|uniref:Essential MCU regulator, mitochondrial n=1 Tax=Silurus meridionalis TaxID=175797 RepID=A0A8T0A6C5_SILME|nr:hypothetical protein HF521_015901 [Silurus meridionalis]KAI5087570.1 essential MCU regulator, mitochondrial [Silurus meridionalis]